MPLTISYITSSGIILSLEVAMPIVFIAFISMEIFAAEEIRTIKRFVFGSCNNQNYSQPLWKEMLKQKPDLFIWGGDNVYSDKERPMNLKLSFEKQNANTDYQYFKSKVPVIGTWDDHDYGGSNSNGYYSGKVEGQKQFLNFIGEPEQTLRRKQEGIYTSHRFGKIKFILLDNRYFKDLEPKAAMLGSTQWKWLENELQNDNSKLIFIVSGLSMLSPLHPFSDGTWSNYPTERDRLLELVEKERSKGVVFLTGDLHFSSIFKRRGHLEFLSSGMTHTASPVLWGYLGRRYQTSFFGVNYGQVDIAWEGENPVITLSIRNRASEEFHKRTFRLNANEWVEQNLLGNH